MKPEWSYLLYCAVATTYHALLVGGFGYVVFILGYSGWWFALMVCLCFKAWTPERWSSLYDPNIAEKYRRQKAASE